jgi:hypothetical protein
MRPLTPSETPVSLRDWQTFATFSTTVDGRRSVADAIRGVE